MKFRDDIDPANTWVVSDTHVFSARIVNSFSFGHQTDLQHAGEDEKGVSPLAGDDVVKAIGLQGVNPSGYHVEGFPAMSISGVTGFGAFVALDNIYVEGLVHVSELGSDYFHFDAGKHQLMGERTHKRYRLGDRVRVKVVRVDLDTSRIDFVLA